MMKMMEHRSVNLISNRAGSIAGDQPKRGGAMDLQDSSLLRKRAKTFEKQRYSRTRPFHVSLILS
jgi:hypothetical protein